MLGSGDTKSKINVKDNLKTVYSLRNAANAVLALQRLYQAKSLQIKSIKKVAPIAAHHSCEDSFDSKLTALTCIIAREQLPDVQDHPLCPFQFNTPKRRP